MSNSVVESSEESLKSIDDSSDISDEQKELCSTLLSLQPYQLQLERESGSESESEVNNDINQESTTTHLEARVGNCFGVNGGNAAVLKNGKQIVCITVK